MRLPVVWLVVRRVSSIRFHHLLHVHFGALRCSCLPLIHQLCLWAQFAALDRAHLPQAAHLLGSDGGICQQRGTLVAANGGFVGVLRVVAFVEVSGHFTFILNL